MMLDHLTSGYHGLDAALLYSSSGEEADNHREGTLGITCWSRISPWTAIHSTK